MPRTRSTRREEAIIRTVDILMSKEVHTLKCPLRNAKIIVDHVLETGMTVAETAKEQRVAVPTVNSIVDTYT